MSTRVTVVCGASSDIGLALLSKLLGSDQSRVVAHCHRSAERLTPLATAYPDRCLTVPADLGREDGCRELIDRVATAGWTPTHFVHLSALPLVYERFEKFDWAHFLNDLELQVGALARLLPAWLPRPRRPGELRDVVVVSSSVTIGVPPKYLSMYTTVKYAQLGLVRSLTAEYADRGVVFNTVSPSMVDTRFLNKIPSAAREMTAAASPLRRNGTPNEVADVIELLLSVHRPLLSGSNLALAGGANF